MIKKKFRITDMHCASCALTIDMDLEDLDGIKSSRTNYAKAETEVALNPQKVSDTKIVETIKNSGYTAVPR